jgi:hypothetical protein
MALQHGPHRNARQGPLGNLEDGERCDLHHRESSGELEGPERRERPTRATRPEVADGDSTRRAQAQGQRDEDGSVPVGVAGGGEERPPHLPVGHCQEVGEGVAGSHTRRRHPRYPEAGPPVHGLAGYTHLR